MNKREAGRLGGKATHAKYGSTYMAEIGRKGARRFWEKYSLVPLGTSNFAIVERTSGRTVAFTNGSFLPPVAPNQDIPF